MAKYYDLEVVVENGEFCSVKAKQKRWWWKDKEVEAFSLSEARIRWFELKTGASLYGFEEAWNAREVRKKLDELRQGRDTDPIDKALDDFFIGRKSDKLVKEMGRVKNNGN